MTERANRKIRIGHVVSDKMDKTVVVRVKPRCVIPFTAGLSSRVKSLKLMMKIMNPTLGIK